MQRVIKSILHLGLTVSLFIPVMGWSADYQKGLDAAKRGDYATALKEWKPLAEQGETAAQFNLGVMYAKGDGVDRNIQEAVKWWRLAAEQGPTKAQTFLGNVYSKGEYGVPKNGKEALKWYSLAAKQGDSEAQYWLASRYAHGTDGVFQDYVKAYAWFAIAVRNGLKKAVWERNRLGRKMDRKEIKKALRLARECINNKYEGC